MNPKTCKHFTGTQHKQCACGVVYETLFKEGREIPCLVLTRDMATDKRTLEDRKRECPKIQMQSAEEIAAREAELNATIERFKKLGPIIKAAKVKYKGQSHQWIEACPICGKNLHLAISSYNGHMRGQCETKDCAWWME